MRKIDKIKNLQKVNLLVERRYLDDKSDINENLEPQKGDKITWISPPKEISRLLSVMTGAKGEYIGREKSGEYVVEFGSKIFYANDFDFELAKQ